MEPTKHAHKWSILGSYLLFLQLRKEVPVLKYKYIISIVQTTLNMQIPPKHLLFCIIKFHPGAKWHTTQRHKFSFYWILEITDCDFG